MQFGSKLNLSRLSACISVLVLSSMKRCFSHVLKELEQDAPTDSGANRSLTQLLESQLDKEGFNDERPQLILTQTMEPKVKKEGLMMMRAFLQSGTGE